MEGGIRGEISLSQADSVCRRAIFLHCTLLPLSQPLMHTCICVQVRGEERLFRVSESPKTLFLADEGDLCASFFPLLVSCPACV